MMTMIMRMMMMIPCNGKRKQNEYRPTMALIQSDLRTIYESAVCSASIPSYDSNSMEHSSS